MMRLDEMVRFVNNPKNIDLDILKKIGTSVSELSFLLENKEYDILAEIIENYKEKELHDLMTEDNPHSKKDYSCL